MIRARATHGRQSEKAHRTVIVIFPVGFPACGKTAILSRFAQRMLRRWHASQGCTCEGGCLPGFEMGSFEALLRNARGHLHLTGYSREDHLNHLSYTSSDVLTRGILEQSGQADSHTEDQYKAAVKLSKEKMRALIHGVPTAIIQSGGEVGEICCIIDRNFLPNSFDFAAKINHELTRGFGSGYRVHPVLLLPSPDVCDSFTKPSQRCGKCGERSGARCGRVHDFDATMTPFTEFVWSQYRCPSWPLPWSIQSCLESSFRALNRKDHLTLNGKEKILFVLFSFLTSFTKEHTRGRMLWRGPNSSFPILRKKFKYGRVLEVESLAPTFTATIATIPQFSECLIYCIQSIWWLVTQSGFQSFQYTPGAETCLNRLTEVILWMTQVLEQIRDTSQQALTCSTRVERIVDQLIEECRAIRCADEHSQPIQAALTEPCGTPQALLATQRVLLEKMVKVGLPDNLCLQCAHALHSWRQVPQLKVSNRREGEECSATEQFEITHAVVAFSGLSCFVLKPINASSPSSKVIHTTLLFGSKSYSTAHTDELLQALAPSLAAVGVPLTSREDETHHLHPTFTLELLKAPSSQEWDLAYTAEVPGSQGTRFRDVLVLPLRSGNHHVTLG